MSEWKGYKLEEVTEPIKDTFNPVGSNEYAYIGLEHIEQETLRLNSAGISSDVKSNKFLFKPNDILFGKLRPYFRKVVQPKFSGICSTDIWVLRAKKGFNQNYLYYFVANWDFVNTANSGEGGTRMPRADWNFLKTTEWNFPALPEQIQIASILSSLDDKIDLLHRQNKTLEQLAETLFRQWFVEEAEDTWEEVLLGEFILVKHGYAFKGNYISPDANNLILVTPGNFKIGGGFKFDKFKYYTDSAFPDDYVFHTGDLVVTMTDLSVQGDTLGYPALIPENYSNELYLHNQRVGKVMFKKEISKSFIYQLMRTKEYQWFILGGASGTAIRHTSPTSICAYSFAMPPKQILLEFEDFAIGIEEKIKTNQNQIRTLIKIRDTLLPNLMSGEVRVK